MLILEEHSEFVYVYEFFLLPNICFNVKHLNKYVYLSSAVLIYFESFDSIDCTFCGFDFEQFQSDLHLEVDYLTHY